MSVRIQINGDITEGYVYLIEDDESLRAQIAKTLEAKGLAVEQYSCAESFRAVEFLKAPAVIVSDMMLPGITGVALLESLRTAGIKTPMVFISGYSNPHQIIAGMKLGAVDFLWKPFKGKDLLEAIAKALLIDSQQQVLSEAVTRARSRWASLTEREREVCKLMLSGMGNTAVAETLSIKPDTANKHRMKVLAKMDVKDRAELAVLVTEFRLMLD